MLIKPGLAVSEMSGKFGGVVAAHNRFGQYFRQFRIPTDPQTPSQMQRRAAMAAAIVAWRNLLGADKDTWNNYAANTPWVNRLGDTVYLTGMSFFIRSYCFAAMLADENSLPPPTVGACGSTGGLPDNAAGVVATLGVAAGLSLAFDDTSLWCAEDNALCLIRMSRPRPSTKVYGGGPYRYATAILGASALPPASPAITATVDLPYAFDVDDRVDFLIRVYRADETLSSALKVSTIAVA